LRAVIFNPKGSMTSIRNAAFSSPGVLIGSMAHSRAQKVVGVFSVRLRERRTLRFRFFPFHEAAAQAFEEAPRRARRAPEIHAGDELDADLRRVRRLRVDGEP